MPTLEQQRARHAWEKSEGCSKDYMNLAKGLPALVMNSGLMQVMAFLHEKGQKDSQRHCRILGDHLRQWLSSRFTWLPDGFDNFMEAMMQTDSIRYQEVTTEAFAWLRWMRQMAAARIGDS